MASSDLDTLIEMGFERERAQLAVKETGGLQGAIDWLDKNQDKSLDDVKTASTQQQQGGEGDEDGPALKPGEEPKSLVCNECGKKFRSQAQAEFHASKTEHVDFSESTEEIAPLTEEEKKARLEELRERLAAKRATQTVQDKEDAKRNESIRRKATKESQDIKEDLQKKERLKEAAAKKREKQEEIDAKKRIQAKIAADKEERKLKAERERMARDAQTLPADSSIPSGSATPASVPAAAPAAKANHTEARLRLQTPSGTIQQTFAADVTLFEVAQAIATDNGFSVSSFQTNFPRKTFDQADFGLTLREAGMVPSAALIVR